MLITYHFDHKLGCDGLQQIISQREAPSKIELCWHYRTRTRTLARGIHNLLNQVLALIKSVDRLWQKIVKSI